MPLRPARSTRSWTGSDYTVPTRWQGTFRRPDVIRDKKGGQSTRRLRDRPELLDRLRRTVQVPVRAVHVVRNPFDNIASMKLRRDAPLESVAEQYPGLCDAMAALRRRRSGPTGVPSAGACVARPQTVRVTGQQGSAYQADAPTSNFTYDLRGVVSTAFPYNTLYPFVRLSGARPPRRPGDQRPRVWDRARSAWLARHGYPAR
jgi:hypothetical protein